MLIFLPEALPAQQVFSGTAHKFDCLIPYTKSGNNGQAWGNAILREMAKDVLREPWLVQIRVKGTVDLSFVTDSNHTKLFISMRSQGIDGDTVFRHFSVRGVLFPSCISMKLRWANRADTSGYVEQVLPVETLSKADSVLYILPVGSYDPKVDTLLVRDVELSYDSLALYNFLDRVELIHDYYAAVALLDSLQQFTASLSLDNPVLLPLNFLKVEEVNSVTERIDARDFPGRLLKNGYDPRGLMWKYQQMLRHSRTLTYNFMDQLRKTGAIPWDGNADRLAEYFTSRIYSYVRRSFLMDQTQGRIYGDCLDHFFDQSAFPPEEQVVPQMLSKMFPEAGLDTVAGFISKRIYASYQCTAQKLIDSNQFADAFSMMENGKRFIAGNPFLKGMAADEKLQSEAAEGIWNSYIGIASSCIASHKYRMADTYLAKADQYAITQSRYIRSDSSYRAVFSQLFFLRNVDCDQMLEQKKYAEALDCYQQFEQSYSPRDLALVSRQLDEKKSRARIGLGKISELLSVDALNRKAPDTALFYYEQAKALRQDARAPEPVDVKLDSLAPVMARIKFEQIFKDGTVALEKRQFTLAVNRLKEGKILADSYKLDRGREFDSVYRQAMKNLLIVQLSSSQKKIWANQFDSAEIALQHTKQAGYDFGLLNEPDFIAAMASYGIKIREQKCRNLQDSVDLRMIRADRNIALRNYVNAQGYLRQALAMAQSMPGCAIAEKPILDTISKYEQATVYQQKLAEVRSLVTTGEYAKAIEELDALQVFYQSHHLRQFGIQHPGVSDFIRERNNPYLTEKAITFYLGRENYPHALGLLLMAHEQGVAAGNVAVAQEVLGRTFAKQDYPGNTVAEALNRTGKYVPEDDWFNAFRSSYNQEWNRMVKESGGKEK